MTVWETSKDDVNRLNKIIDLQRDIIDILIINNNYLYEQLNMQKDNTRQHTEYEKLLVSIVKNEKS